MQFTENECKLHVMCSVAIYSDVHMSRLSRVSTRKINTENYKSFLAFFNLGRVVSSLSEN